VSRREALEQALEPPSSVATGHLVNGAFSLPSFLQARGRKADTQGTAYNNVGSSASPLNLLTWSGPVSNDAVALQFAQHIDANDALRTGSYSNTLTFSSRPPIRERAPGRAASRRPARSLGCSAC
jgi:hypothetical protein